MFERFTRPSRDAVVAAQAVAAETGATTIDSRHLLVALLAGADATSPVGRALAAVDADPAAAAAAVRTSLATAGDLDAEALASLGIDLDAIRARADEVFGPGVLDGPAGGRPAGGNGGGRLPFSGDAKKTLELALREAIRMKSREIDDRHLMLGLLRDTRNPARTALAAVLPIEAFWTALETA